MVYYNEKDAFAVEWLLQLIKGGHIADGLVDDRSIEDVTPNDLKGFTQCHFFAGIGGWSLALHLAGWPDDQPVWTGSCPCQPFSAAGKSKGFADERHLWPSWFWLIDQCRPSVIVGEQVEAAIRHGWLDLVRIDLEGKNYAFGAVGLPAACVETPHERRRLYFIADTYRQVLARSKSTICTITSGQKEVEWGAITSALSLNTLGSELAGSEYVRQPMLQSGHDGLYNRVGRLRGYGNAIVPPVAAEFIKAYMSLNRV